MRAYMRVLGEQEQPLEFIDVTAPGVVCVDVPGFGFLVATVAADHPNADRAIISRGPGTERQRTVTRVDGRIECEMLHKADRLCVVIDPEGE